MEPKRFYNQNFSLFIVKLKKLWFSAILMFKFAEKYKAIFSNGVSCALVGKNYYLVADFCSTYAGFSPINKSEIFDLFCRFFVRHTLDFIQYISRKFPIHKSKFSILFSTRFLSDLARILSNI